MSIRNPAGRIALIYLVIGAAWILCSDHMLGLIIVDNSRIKGYSVGKGLVFIAVTTALLYSLIHAIFARLQSSQHAPALSRERYLALVQASAQIVWRRDAKSGIDDVEALLGWEEFTGQPLAETRDMGCMKLVHPEDLPRFTHALREGHNSAEAHELEYRLRHRDGSWRVMKARVVPVFEAGGRLREWVGASIDITAQRTAELEQRHQQERNEILIHCLWRDRLRPRRHVRQHCVGGCDRVDPRRADRADGPVGCCLARCYPPGRPTGSSLLVRKVLLGDDVRGRVSLPTQVRTLHLDVRSEREDSRRARHDDARRGGLPEHRRPKANGGGTPVQRGALPSRRRRFAPVGDHPRGRRGDRPAQPLLVRDHRVRPERAANHRRLDGTRVRATQEAESSKPMTPLLAHTATAERSCWN